MIASEYSNSVDHTDRNLAAQSTRLNYRVRCENLSREAVTFLRRIVRMMRNDGSPVYTAAEFARQWANGYRAHQYSVPQPVGAHTAFVDGWQFAYGEDQYLTCMAVDDCQETANTWDF